jgi:acetyl-CoA decarbonylase/synthase, CODH/ACS complex subunit gamma
MALSGLDIYKLLPKTNCRECGLATCLAFAMQLAKKTVNINKCPHVTSAAKDKLNAASLPPIRLVKIGTSDSEINLGNDTVLFRHEEKFFHPSAIGIIIEENITKSELNKKIEQINKLSFERIGESLSINIIALKYFKDKSAFIGNLKYVLENSKLAICLMVNDAAILKDALELTKGRNPLIYPETTNNIETLAQLAKEYNSVLVASENNLNDLSELTLKLNKLGLENLILDTGKKEISEKLSDLTQIRRLALKKRMRSLGYPVICSVEENDFYACVNEASIYILKYAGIVLLKHSNPEQILPLLTLRQNIYTDPQKPLQVEPKVYPIGQTNENSPILITTNFSLSYFTVLSEVEASKIPSYILSVDTEGMSVLTAWAAEKFTPEKIAKSLDLSGLKETVKQKKVIIPGYVAVMSGDLEEKSGWKVMVGPKEAAGITTFLRNLS